MQDFYEKCDMLTVKIVWEAIKRRECASYLRYTLNQTDLEWIL